MAKAYTLLSGTNTTASTATIPLDKIGRHTNYSQDKIYSSKVLYVNDTSARESKETFVNTATKLPKGSNPLPDGIDSPNDLVKNVKYDRNSRTYVVFLEETESTDPTYRRLYPLMLKLESTIPDFNGITEAIVDEVVSRALSSYVSDAGVMEFLPNMSSRVTFDKD
jgi:hypothetical protein